MSIGKAEFSEALIAGVYLASKDEDNRIVAMREVMPFLPKKAGWVHELIKSNSAYHVFNLDQAAEEIEFEVQLSEEGIEFAKRVLESQTDTPRSAILEFMRRFEAARVSSSEGSNSETSAHIDSTQWTGPKYVLTDAKVIRSVRIKATELRDLIYDTPFESNSDSQDLKSLADALVAIANMAEPELTILDKLLAHPKFQKSAKLVAAVAVIRGAIGF